MIDAQPWMTAMAAMLLTVAAYSLALWAYRRSGWSLLLPVLTGSAVVVAVLLGAGIPYGSYREGAKPLSWLAGPATVALALPLYRQRGRLQGIWWPVMGALLAGSVTAVISAMGIAWLLGGDWSLMMSLAPKSATMPVAMPVAESMGGSAPISAVAVALTGISAAVLAGGLLSLLKIRHDVVRGFALGASAHAIGTAQAFQISEAAVGFAALAMGLNAIATSVLVPLIGGAAVSLPVTWLNPPSEIDPHTLQILGICTSDEILFSVQAIDKRVASALTRIAFYHSVLCAYGRRMRLEGAATIQDSMQTGILIVRSKFTVLTDF